MKITKAMLDLRLIMLRYLEACLDFVHYPPSGSRPRLRHLWANLSPFPCLCCPWGVPCPKAIAAAGGRDLCSGDGGLAENRGPVRQTGGSGIFILNRGYGICLDVKGGIFAGPGVPASSGSPSSTTLGYRPPGWPPGGRPAWRSFDPAVYPGAAEVDKDGRFA